MEQNNDNQVRADVDVMDVSPTAPPDVNPTADENKENCDADLEPAPLVAPPTNTTQQKNIPDPVAAPLPASTASQSQQPSAPSPPEEDNREAQFTYVLRKYDSIAETRVYSPWHFFGSFKWRLLIFPRGNHTSNTDLSVYLECGGPCTREDQSQSAAATNHSISPNGKEAAVSTVPPNSWSRPAKFSLHILHPTTAIAKAAVNSDAAITDPSLADLDVTDDTHLPQAAPRNDFVKETSHLFRHHVSDWGFLEFAPFSTLQPKGYADAEMNVAIMVKIRLQDQSSDPAFATTQHWDSRKETGLVGFKNQGATCYMNSLLQTLYMLSAFRKAVYNMPLPEMNNDIPEPELSYALQKVFYELQFSPTVVKTKKLTESFGWDTTDAFTQHDVQELKLILCDELAEKMKKISPDQPNSLSTLFQGKILNYIECVNVSYKSTREEEFSDLSLNVKGCQNIYESFQKYTEVEMMDGDNKYRADGFEDLQDAKKGVKFLKLPPVLQLHLKRFEYDTTRDAMVKINDRYEFETEIDLSCFVANSNGSDVYVLHSVLVHIGDVNGGHYHAFIRPEIDTSDNEPKKPSQWFKFDDETVSLATEDAAVHDNYGVGGEKDFAKRGMDDELGNGGVNGQTPPPNVFLNRNRNYQPRRYSNAYMLQYLRKTDVNYLLSLPSPSDVPDELAARIKKEREEEEQRKRDNTEQHLYMSISVATDDDMAQHRLSDLVNWDKLRPLRVKRATQLGELKMLLQNETFVGDARRMRLWKCIIRQNQTIRPDSLVANGDDSQPIDNNGRDPLAHTGFTVPIYTGRHGYYGHDDVMRLYAEDLGSKFCLAAGISFAAFENGAEENNAEKKMEVSADEQGDGQGKMQTDSVGFDYAAWSFPLKADRETLLFLKYYTSKPYPRLQWLGHFVVDRTYAVKELKVLMRSAVESLRQVDDSLPAISEEAELSAFEEVCATSVKELDMSKTLEQHLIPCDSGSGDVIVFQESVPGLSKIDMVNGDEGDDDEMLDIVGWNGLQEVSRGDGTDFPLGGRPLPLLTMYYDYLAYRIKIEFKDRHSVGGPDEGKSIIFEVSRKDSYRTARKVLSGALGEDMDPDYLRFFSHDFNREAPTHEAFRSADDIPLERLVPLHSLVSSGQPEYRIIWYEQLEYHISEFEDKEEVRVVWRPDGGARSTGYMTKSGIVGIGIGNGKVGSNVDGVVGPGRAKMSIDGEANEESGGSENGGVGNKCGSMKDAVSGSGHVPKRFSVLVGLPAKFADVIEEIRMKLDVKSDVGIRMLEVKGNRIMRIVESEENVGSISSIHDYGSELRAEIVGSDETQDALEEPYDLVGVVHLAKEKSGRAWRGLQLFGEPFLVKVDKNGESVEKIRRRIQAKIGVPSEEFDSWALAEISQSKAGYLEDGAMYKPGSSLGMELCTLAIEHKSTAPPKRTPVSVSRHADKPLKIRS